jgi:hypothetical protein
VDLPPAEFQDNRQTGADLQQRVHRPVSVETDGKWFVWTQIPFTGHNTCSSPGEVSRLTASPSAYPMRKFMEWALPVFKMYPNSSEHFLVINPPWKISQPL